ncbi:MAG: Hsp20/alpha crystallin family protein [Gemmatimonadales bacterium]
MADTGSGRRSGGGAFFLGSADELEVYFNEVAHGRPVGFVASNKWRPPTDLFETAGEFVVHMDIAGLRSEEIQVELVDDVLRIWGERRPHQEGKRHYHSMEVQVGPFERRLRLPVPVDPASVRANYEAGFLEVRVTKLPERRSGAVKVS